MEVVELTKSLISCPSVTPNNEGVLDLLKRSSLTWDLHAIVIYLVILIPRM